MEREKPRSRKKKPLGVKFFAALGGGVLVTAAAIAAIVYIQVGKQYRQVFFPNTTINGIDASKKTAEEVKGLIAAGIDGYALSLEERDGKTEKITGESIGLESVFDGSLEKLLGEQNPNQWFAHRSAPQVFEIGTMIQYDETKFGKMIDDLDCFDEESVIKPEDAYISDYVSGQGYALVPAVFGNELDREVAAAAIEDAVMNLKDRISFEELDAYKKPSVTEEDPLLVQQVQNLNQYVNVTVTHTFGDAKEVLDGNIISGWVSRGEDGSVPLDGEKVTEYVKGLASKYDTYNKAKNLKTSYGSSVKITGGSYGWRINQSQEADEVAAIIRSGESQTREPVYRQKAASHGVNDYGSTYVEINLTAQHLYYYKNGSLVVQSDFVSGNESKGWSTPAGIYPLTYKERNATLKGEDYRTPVDYWMPFNGGIGLHDATWRSSFGGSIYKTGGSHGCVNLPHSVAQTIFENISSGTPVLCYHLGGSESKTTSGSSGKPQPTTAAPAETTAAPTTEAASTESAAPAPDETSAAGPSAPDATKASQDPSDPETSPVSDGGEKGPGVPENGPGEAEIGPGV